MRTSRADPDAALAAEYSAKALEYDHYWSPVIRPMARPLVDALPLAGARRILDAGSGTGAHLVDLRRLAPGASLVAVDRAEGMLRAGARALAPAAVMDLQALGVAAQVFDVVVLIFVLFHLPDPLAGLREARRVLRRGGTVGLTTWGEDPGTPGIPIWRAALDEAGAPPDPRDPSVMQQSLMDTPEKLTVLLHEAGFANVRTWRADVSHTFSADALFVLHTTCGSPLRRLERLDVATRREVEARARASLDAMTPEALVYRAEVLFCLAEA